MIRATFLNKNNVYSLTIFGHANYAEYGEDIVCASVSALTTATVNEMAKYIDTIVVRGNDIQLSFVAVQTSQSPIDHHLFRLYEMLKENFLEIEQHFPKNIEVVIQDE